MRTVVPVCPLLCAAVASAVASVVPRPAWSQDSCAVGSPIPAYAHNDYENTRPLLDALALGYQGVEADVHFVRSRLLVAHDRYQVTPERTLEALYLEPLRTWIARCGDVLPHAAPLLLNIELKTPGAAAYRALLGVLRRYRDMLTVVRDGREYPGPVQVVLVGWAPPLDELEEERERLVAVQWYADDGDVPAVPAHLIRLVTLDYGKRVHWDGHGTVPPDAGAVVARLVRARDAAPGRLARVHNLPVDQAIYRFLLDAGVDLIGTKRLAETHEVLAGF